MVAMLHITEGDMTKDYHRSYKAFSNMQRY
jgi:hypothetical protein